MPNFTKGKWEATPIYGDHWTVSADRHVIIDCFSNEANARLIAAAPEMYRLLLEVVRNEDIYAPTEKRIRELLARIDSKEEE